MGILAQDASMRYKVIGDIGSEENKKRKQMSFAQYEIFKDRLYNYVENYLKSKFKKETVDDMTIISCINILKRIAEKKSTIYKKAPQREFTELSEEQVDELLKFYSQIKFNDRMQMSNEYFNVHRQSVLWLNNTEKGAKFRVLMPHQFDVVTDDFDHSEPVAYIINTFNRGDFSTYKSDGTDQSISDPDDYKKSLERYLVFENDVNFIMNGRGEIVSDVVENADVGLPFINIADLDDSEFFVRGGSSEADFTVQYNGAYSDLGYVVKMQGFAVGWIKAPPSTMPENITIGPNKLVKLTLDPNNPQLSADMGYASPSSDIAGSLGYIDSLLGNFMSSRGMDVNTVNSKPTATTYSSGFDRFLAMVETFEASSDDFKKYEEAEKAFYELLKKMSNKFVGTPFQMLGFMIPESSVLNVKFDEPKMVESEVEKVARIQTKKEQGLISQVEAIMEDRKVERVKAIEILEQIAEDDDIYFNILREKQQNEESDGDGRGSEPDAQI